MEHIILSEMLRSLEGLKEQSDIAMKVLVHGNSHKLDNIKLGEAQAKINPNHLNIFHAYISYSKDESYVDINETLFVDWWENGEAKNIEDNVDKVHNSDTSENVKKDLKEYKPQGYTPYGTYSCEYLEMEIEFGKEDYLSSAKNTACSYSAVIVLDNGELGHLPSGKISTWDTIKNISYRILPVYKRNLGMVSDTDYVVISKEEFMVEVHDKKIDRRFDSIAYRVEESKNEPEHHVTIGKTRDGMSNLDKNTPS